MYSVSLPIRSHFREDFCLLQGWGYEGSVSENEAGRVEPYSEFIIRRHNEQQVTGYSFIIVTAVAFLALAGIFIFLYFSV